MMPIAILAGGLATRLRPITEKIPKALIEIAGKPFITWQLAHLSSQGIKRVVICTGFLSEQIEAVIKNGAAFGLEVSYSRDGSKLLGTGGAIINALPLLGDAFFVLYGDSFLPIDFRPIQAAFDHSKKSALMTILENKNRWDKSNVLFKNGKLLEYNKEKPRSDMHYIDYGLGVLTAGALKQYSNESPLDLSLIYHQLSMNDDLSAYEVYNRFYEIGSRKGIQESEEYFLRIAAGKDAK